MAQIQSRSCPLTQGQTSAVKAELQAILASEAFSGSNRCREFLEFVVTRALAGDLDNLTERFIGVEVFGRDVNYETSTDAIVRVRANDVRRRLAQYYSGHQNVSPVRIDLVAGGYVPEFNWRTEASPVCDSPESSHLVVHSANTGVSRDTVAAAETEPRRVPARARLFWWSGAVGLLIATILIALISKHRTSNFDRFWQPFLQKTGSPVLVLPASNTFQLSPQSAHRLATANDGQPITISAGDLQEFHNWHISLPVVQATLSIMTTLQRQGQTPLVRMGADLKRDELRGHPIIAIGSFSNPWTEENASGLRFTFDRGASDDEIPRIRDGRNPQRIWSLPAIYPEVQNKDYAIITRTFDPETHEPFVSLAGLHSFGNQIAGEFVSQDSSWDELAARAPVGWEKMNLQILLEADIVGTTPSSPRIIDVYFWK